MALRDRLMDIYNQEAAMGLGCEMCPRTMTRYGMNYDGGDGEDYDYIFGDSVPVGGNRKNKAAAKKNPWLAFLCNFKKKYDLEGMSAAKVAEIASQYYYDLGPKKKNALKGTLKKCQGGRLRKAPKRMKRKSGSKTMKKKSKAKRSVSGGASRTTLAKKLGMLNMTLKEYNKLTPYQKTRVGKFYATRTKQTKRCRIPDPLGEFFLKRPKKCIRSTRNLKKKQ